MRVGTPSCSWVWSDSKVGKDWASPSTPIHTSSSTVTSSVNSSPCTVSVTRYTPGSATGACGPPNPKPPPPCPSSGSFPCRSHCTRLMPSCPVASRSRIISLATMSVTVRSANASGAAFSAPAPGARTGTRPAPSPRGSAAAGGMMSSMTITLRPWVASTKSLSRGCSSTSSMRTTGARS